MKNKLTLLTLIISFSGLSQNPTFEWANQIPGGNDQIGNSIVTDSNGDVVVVGEFDGTVDFDPGSGTMNLTSNGNSDIFVQKLNSNGDLLWVKQIGAGWDDFASSVTVDANNNVYVTGRFRGDVDFDPGSGTNNLFVQFSDDMYLLKLDSNGDFVWAHQFGDPSTGSKGNSIMIDNSGDILVTGYFSGTVDFDPSASTQNLVASNSDVFVLKLDVNGNFIWVKQVGGTDLDSAESITADLAGNVYVVGVFRQTADFDPGTGVSNLTSNGNNDGFILKLDVNGDFQWVNQVGGTEFDAYLSVDVDINNDIIATGYFAGTVDLDPGSTVTNYTSAGGADLLIQKFSPAGAMIWVNHIGGTGADLAFGIKSDEIGDIYLTGQFYLTVDFDPGPGIYNMTASSVDAFILKLNSNGGFIWGGQMEGSSIGISYAISLDDMNSIYTTGKFQGTVDFDPGTNVSNLSTPVDYDGFVLKLSQCTPNTGTDIQSACDTYDWIDGNTYTSSNNTATHTLTNVGGCDSLVTLDLTINNSNTGTDVISACVSYDWIDGSTYTASNNTATYILTNQAGCDSTVTLDLIINPLPDNNVTQTDVTLSANQASAQYQWLDCDNSYSQINGETNQTYTSGVTGNYAVEVTVNGCADTSACFLVDYSGIDNLISEQIQIYPNPTNDGMMFIHYDGQINIIEVMDMTGRKVSSSVVIENKTIDASKLSMGNYMIHISTNEGVVVKEVTIVK